MEDKSIPNDNVLLPSSKQKKARQVTRELKRLSDLFNVVEENQKDFIQRQLEQLAWLNISIIDLQEKIDRSGTLVEYDNGGGQTGVKPNPDIKTLIDYQKLANTIVRTLNSIVPIKVTGCTSGSLKQFLLSSDEEKEQE